jgi:hypothetical protein
MRYLPVIEKHFAVVSRGGEEILCVCPWHEDKSGHLYINARKGLYLCMVCGAKGSLDGSDKSGRCAFTIPTLETTDVRDRLRQITKRKATVHYYPEGWLGQYDVPHDYWPVERGLSPATIAKWRLGYDPFSDRATIPMRTMHGQIIGVSFRRLDGGTPKYLDPKGYAKGKHLYGAWLLGPDVRTVALVEGQVDAIACDEARVPAVATMGSRLTRDQAKVLQHLGIRKVVGLYDNDNAGRKAVLQTYDMLRGTGIQYAAGWYRPYWMKQTGEGMKPVKDPDDLTPQRLRKMYHSAVPILDWIERTGYKGD